MAEEEHGGGGGHGLAGTITLPGIGPANKKIVFAVGGAGAAYVIWRYWQNSRSAAADTTATDPAAPGYTDPGTLPAVAGAVKPDNGYGLPADDTGGGGGGGFTGTTNSAWSQYAATALSGASDKWSYGDISSALGAYIANRPLTASQQDIVQAAIAFAGPPPEGTHPVIPGGDVPITVAPSGLKVVSTTATTATLSWSAVAGAGDYRAYRSGSATNVGTSRGTTITLGGLTPNTSYSFQVAAETASGRTGPKSGAVTGRTKPVSLAKPSTPRVTAITRSSAHVTVAAVKGATGYLWYLNGAERGHSDAPVQSLSGLKAGTTYRIAVRADTATQSPGPLSGPAVFKTKK
jgi:chitodextrinase